MTKPETELRVSLTKEQADDILDEVQVDHPPLSGGEVRYTLVIKFRSIWRMILKVYDDTAQTEWRINLKTNEIRHRGYGAGCLWVKWEH